jgi:hypothetical protein
MTMTAVMAARANPRIHFIDYLPPSAFFFGAHLGSTNALSALSFPRKLRPDVFLARQVKNESGSTGILILSFAVRTGDGGTKRGDCSFMRRFYRALHERGARQVALRASARVRNVASRAAPHARELWRGIDFFSTGDENPSSEGDQFWRLLRTLHHAEAITLPRQT